MMVAQGVTYRDRRGVHRVTRYELPIVPKGDLVNEDELARAQTAVKEGLTALKNGMMWTLKQNPSEIRICVDRNTLSDEEIRNGITSLKNRFLPLTKAFVAHDGAVFFMARAAELLLDKWTRLRTCQRGDCRTIFLPRRKDQLYCSDKCGSKERVRRHRRL